jgi:glycerol uptake facilitator protein
LEGRREPRDTGDEPTQRDQTRRARIAETVARRRMQAASATDVELPEERGPAAFLAEFVGTFALVFFVTMAVVLFLPGPEAAPQPTLPGQPPPEAEQPFQDWAVVGLVHVFVLFLIIQTLAIISGAHVNPAVTVALAAIRQIRGIDAAIYVVVQLAGATLGALLTKLIVDDEGEPLHHGATEVSRRVEQDIFPAGFAVEAIGTFFLVWAIVGVAVNPRALKDWAGLVIGGTLGLAVMTLGPITGGGFNPARVFGPALVSNHFEGIDTFIVAYVLGPLVGALLAASIYFYLFILPGRRAPGGMEPVG